MGSQGLTAAPSSLAWQHSPHLCAALFHLDKEQHFCHLCIGFGTVPRRSDSGALQLVLGLVATADS